MISVIIPTFGNFTRLSKLLQSISRLEKDYYEAIAINDKPTSGGWDYDFIHDQAKTPLIRLQNDTNLGFAKSINKGLKAAKGDILLLCNDDIVFTQPVFSKIEAEFKADPTLGILGALLYYPTKQIQHAGMNFDLRTKSFIHEKRLHGSKFMIAVTGAFFAVSRAAYEKLGGLDESYFLACEDTKYCLDAWKAGFKVKYSQEISAIHEEGATRGRTPMQKRRFKEWTTKEKIGINKFKASLNLVSIANTQKSIHKLNNSHLKIELGSGYNPNPGYKHLDVRAGLPELDYVCDFTKEKLPFEDGSVDEILANHVIEHIPFRKLPFVIKEWVRVLDPVIGKLILRTPNLRFIMEKYLAGEITPEWPGDEKFIKDNLSNEITPAWWANLKLFSGQDYDANFHHVCFDFEMLEDLLGRYGFKHVEKVKFDKEYSPGELQVEAYKSEVDVTNFPKSIIPRVQEVPLIIHGMNSTTSPTPEAIASVLPNEVKETIYNAIKENHKNYPPKPKSCLVRRDGAMGDVILTTPIIERLSKEFKIIDVCTKVGDVFKYNPHIRSATLADPFTWPNLVDLYDQIIDLNLAYEKNPKMHIVDAYSMVAFGDTDTPHEIKLYEPKVEKQDFVVIHAARSWENRTWKHENWCKLLNELGVAGETCMVVGAKDDQSFSSLFCDFDCVGHQNFWSLVEAISKAKLFIGFDSGPLHIAQAVDTPSIGLFTCAKAEYRTTAKNILTVIPKIECYGCLHDEKPPVTYCGCRRGDLKCLDLITPEMVIEQYEEFKRKRTCGTGIIENSNSTTV